MKIMTASNHWMTKQLAAKYPKNIGVILQPSNPYRTGELPYVIDNGMYGLWRRGKKFDEQSFIALLERYKTTNKQPEFVVVPDAPTDATKTLELWEKYKSLVEKYKYPKAFAMQNGHSLSDIPKSAEWVFIGGSDGAWRNWAIKNVCPKYPTHVGRISGKMIWFCHCAGAKSCDSSGWFRGDRAQLEILLHYLQCVNLDFEVNWGETPKDSPHHQLSLFDLKTNIC